ncbi:hypothetical protein V1L52_04530 [Treponema sp. HNW]|uniref:hypothetical protein n=1 Tax=Treponema sp. HNW TaxID=3116654 RepID=UPI003D1278A7
MTKEELAEFRPWYEIHPDRAHLSDENILTHMEPELRNALKIEEEGYQKRINQVLRWTFDNNCPYMVCAE